MKSQINSLEDAFKAQGIDTSVRPDVSNLPEEFQKHTILNFELEVLIMALNSEGLDKNWMPDYSDFTQPKYEHWYSYSSASGWSVGHVDRWRAFTGCGSRRVFRTREIAWDAWERFPELFKAAI